jgi:hypothetical protein
VPSNHLCEALDVTLDAAELPKLDQLLGHVAAVTDAPCNIFGPELIEAYPEAKVVLIERDIEAWYVGWEGLLDSAFSPLLRFLL